MSYKIKKNKKLIKKLQPYWERLQRYESVFECVIKNLEEQMERETGIKGIYFFQCDGESVGIGNINPILMDLIHNEELEKGKIINYD